MVGLTGVDSVFELDTEDVVACDKDCDRRNQCFEMFSLWLKVVLV